MGINFPSSPTVGQVFQPAGGPAWLWTFEGKWRRWPGTALVYNRIINPSMQISQQNGDVLGNANGYFAADQWPMSRGGSVTGVNTAQRVASITPNASKYRLRMTITTAQASMAAGDYLGFYYRVEGNRISDFQWGTAAARRAVLRFGMKAPAGTWAFAFRSGDTATTPRCYTIPIVVAAGDANKDIEYSFSIPGPQDGSFPRDTACGLELWWTFAAGSNYTTAVDNAWKAGAVIGCLGQSNGFASTSNVFEIFDVGLYADPSKTGVAPPFQAPHYEDDFYDCLRFCYKRYAARGRIYSTTQGHVIDTHPVIMRVVPAYTFFGAPMTNDLTNNRAISAVSNPFSALKTSSANTLLTTTGAVNYVNVNRPLIQHMTTDADFTFFSSRM